MKAKIVTLLAALLAGCAVAPATPAVDPGAASPVGQAPPAAGTPDEPFRYQPPLLSPAGPWSPPSVVEVRFASGVRALLLERHELPFVEARVMVRHVEAPTMLGLDTVLLDLLLDAPPPGSAAPLRDVLFDAGARWHFEMDTDEMGIVFSAPSPVLDEVLGKVLRAMAQFGPKQAVFDASQKRLVKAYEPRDRVRRARPETLRARLIDAVDQQMLPASHRYRTLAPLSTDIAKMKLADVMAWKARAFAPDLVRVVVAGDVAPAGLRATIEGATAGWRATPAKPPPPVAIAHGVFLVEEEGATTVDLGVVFPDPGASAPDYGLWVLGRAALQKEVFDWMRKEIQTPWENGLMSQIERREAPFAYVAVQMQPGDVGRAARGILEAIDRATQREPTLARLEEARRDNLHHLEAGWAGNAEAIARLAWVSTQEMPADALARFYETRKRATPAEALAAARTRLKRGEARVVAVGAVGSAATELATLGLGNVTRVKAGEAEAKKEEKKP